MPQGALGISLESRNDDWTLEAGQLVDAGHMVVALVVLGRVKQATDRYLNRIWLLRVLSWLNLLGSAAVVLRSLIIRSGDCARAHRPVVYWTWRDAHLARVLLGNYGWEVLLFFLLLLRSGSCFSRLLRLVHVLIIKLVVRSGAYLLVRRWVSWL